MIDAAASSESIGIVRNCHANPEDMNGLDSWLGELWP